MAAAGQRLRPPLLPPPSLKPFLRFQKIPPAALGPVRRVVETDAEFRARVMLVATEELVGRAGWLWVHRPDGWEDDLAGLIAEEAVAEEAAGAEKAERTAQRRLEAAEHAARKAVAEVAVLRTELAAERSQRQEADEALRGIERRAKQADVELGGARRRLVEAEDRAAQAEERAAQVEDRVALAEQRAVEAEQRAAEADARVADMEAAAPGDGGNGAREERSSAPPVEPALPEPSLAQALGAAAAAASTLAAALAEASRLSAPQHAEDVEEVEGATARPAATARVERSPRGPRRVPLPLPGGVWADSAEAALHLVRAPGVLLVVDGYNVAKLGWPQLGLAEQRHRLLDALDELAARYATDVRVVFDGADVAQAPIGRRYLRVEFSPPGVTADEVIVALAGSLPAERPVVVATNDAEVRAGVKAAGGNVIGSEQLLDVARR